MRLRNIPGADEIVSNSAFCIQNPTNLKDNWHNFLEMIIQYILKLEWEKEDLSWILQLLIQILTILE